MRKISRASSARDLVRESKSEWKPAQKGQVPMELLKTEEQSVKTKSFSLKRSKTGILDFMGHIHTPNTPSVPETLSSKHSASALGRPNLESINEVAE